MKIISSGSNSEFSMFDIAIRFKPFKGNQLINNEDYLNEICDWAANNFTKNFVILEQVEAIIVGGWVDNKFGWDQNNQAVNRADHSKTAVYELRCSDSDATAFLMRWA